MQERIKDIVHSVTHTPDWGLCSNIITTVERCPFLFSAVIDEQWDTHLKVDPEAEQICIQMLQEQHIANLFQDPFKTAITYALLHAKGHWSVCPYDWNQFEHIVSGCSNAISDLGFGSPNSKNRHIRNNFIRSLKLLIGLFEDLVVDTVMCALYDFCGEYRSGKSIMLLTQLYMTKNYRHPIYRSIPLSKFNSLSIDISIRLSAVDNGMYPLFSSYYPDGYSVMESVVARMILETTKSRTAMEKAMDRSLEPDDFKEIAFTLRDYGNWYDQSYAFSKHLIPFLIQEIEQDDDTGDEIQGSSFSQMLFGFGDKKLIDKNPITDFNIPLPADQPDYGFMNNDSNMDSDDYQGSSGYQDGMEAMTSNPTPVDNESNEINRADGTQPKPNIDYTEKNRDENSVDNDDIDLYEQLNKDLLIKLTQFSIQQNRKVSYAKRYDFLNALYEQRADEVIIDILDEDKDALVTEIAYLSERIENPDTLDIKKIKWSKTRIYPTPSDTGVELYQKEIPLTTSDPVCFDKGDIPDIALIVDSSGTMKADLIKGIGPYDTLLRSQFSLINWIRRTGKAYHMKFAAINFSSHTTYSGWVSFKEIDCVKKELLNYQGKFTRLSPKIIKCLYMERKHPFLAVLTTDGAFQEPEPVAEELTNLVLNGNALCIIQIEHESVVYDQNKEIFLRLMEDYADIYRIYDVKELIGLTIRYTQKYWGSIRL